MTKHRSGTFQATTDLHGVKLYSKIFSASDVPAGSIQDSKHQSWVAPDFKACGGLAWLTATKPDCICPTPEEGDGANAPERGVKD